MQSTDQINVGLDMRSYCTEYDVIPVPIIQTMVDRIETIRRILKGSNLPTYSTLLQSALAPKIFEKTI